MMTFSFQQPTNQWAAVKTEENWPASDTHFPSPSAHVECAGFRRPSLQPSAVFSMFGTWPS